MELLLKQVRYGELTEKDVHPETECRSVDTWFGPLCFYPYRQMTDDELAAFALVGIPPGRMIRTRWSA